METSPAGLAALALFVLWLGFWVPQRLRHRQLLADAQIEDRFSGGLRVLAVADGRGKERAMRSHRGDGAPATGSVPLVGAGATGSAGSTGGAAADSASPRVRTDRITVLERRAARARRRLVVTLALVLLTAGAWTAVGLGYVTWPVAVAPSALLLVVLVLGRVAVLAARRSDERWRAERAAERRRATQQRTLAHGGPYAPRNRARVTGRAVHPSDTSTRMIPRVTPAMREHAGAGDAASGTVRGAGEAAREPADRAREAGDRADDDKEPVPSPELSDPGGRIHPPQPDNSRAESSRTASSGLGGEPWEPVPVPLPTYVTKPAAPRREQATTVPRHEPRDVGPPPVLSEPPAGPAASAASAEAPAMPRDESLSTEEPRPRTETLGLPLEQILARRRAAG